MYIYICVCVCVCVSVCISTHTYMYISVCIYICTLQRWIWRLCPYKFICTYIHTCIHTHLSGLSTDPRLMAGYIAHVLNNSNVLSRVCLNFLYNYFVLFCFLLFAFVCVFLLYLCILVRHIPHCCANKHLDLDLVSPKEVVNCHLANLMRI